MRIFLHEAWNVPLMMRTFSPPPQLLQGYIIKKHCLEKELTNIDNIAAIGSGFGMAKIVLSQGNLQGRRKLPNVRETILMFSEAILVRLDRKECV